MKINSLGAGPAGPYFAILMKQMDPAYAITIAERDGPSDTFFSSWRARVGGRMSTLDRLKAVKGLILQSRTIWPGVRKGLDSDPLLLYSVVV